MTYLLRRTALVAGAIVLLAGLAGIGLAQAASLASTGSVAPQPAPDGVTDTSVPVAVDAAFAADQVTADPAAADRAAAGLLRLRFWQHLVHATATLDLPAKGLTTVQLDHGTVASIQSGSLTIAEAGGTSVTVSLGDETRYRKAGARVKPADVKTGAGVYVMSLVEAGGTEAYLVVVPKG